MSRTGTTSLNLALNLLGYRSIHFPDDDRTREQIMRFLAAGGDSLRLSVLDRFDAMTDTPVCVAFEALDAAYPGSRFILTTRDKASWLDSCRRYWADWIAPALRERGPAGEYMAAIQERLYGAADFDPDFFAQAYDTYHARVEQHFGERADDLLTLDVSVRDPWEPLCAFVRAPRPAIAFPYVQNRE